MSHPGDEDMASLSERATYEKKLRETRDLIADSMESGNGRWPRRRFHQIGLSKDDVPSDEDPASKNVVFDEEQLESAMQETDVLMRNVDNFDTKILESKQRIYLISLGEIMFEPSNGYYEERAFTLAERYPIMEMKLMQEDIELVEMKSVFAAADKTLWEIGAVLQKGTERTQRRLAEVKDRFNHVGRGLADLQKLANDLAKRVKRIKWLVVYDKDYWGDVAEAEISSSASEPGRIRTYGRSQIGAVDPSPDSTMME